jgi:hypothetical protein
MKRSIERVGKIIAVGLAAGIGVTACSETAPKAHNSHEASPSIAGLTRQIIDSDPDGPAWGSGAPGYLPKAGISRETRLPNGTQVELTASTTETLKESREVFPNHVGYPLRVTPKNVDELDVRVYSKGSEVGFDKPEYGFVYTKEAVDKWRVIYYQQFDQRQQYSIGELDKQTVLTSSGPGNVLNSQVYPSQANTIYAQISEQVQTITNDFTQHHNLPNPSVKQ